MPMKIRVFFSKSHRPAGGPRYSWQVAGAKERPGRLSSIRRASCRRRRRSGSSRAKRALGLSTSLRRTGSPADRLSCSASGRGRSRRSRLLKAGGAALRNRGLPKRSRFSSMRRGSKSPARQLRDFALGMEMNAYGFGATRPGNRMTSRRRRRNRSRSPSSPAR